MYTGNEWVKRAMGGTGNLGVAGAAFAGAVTGYIEALGVTPFELVKVRMQSLDHVGKYGSTVDCVKSIVKEEGFLALYNGFWATSVRNCVFNGVFFGSAHWIKHQLPAEIEMQCSDLGIVALDMGVGMGAAFIATTVKMPFDIAKSRLMNQPTPKPGVQAQYQDMTHCIQQTWRHEGVRALYKGFSPTVARMVLGTGVSFAAFELVLKQMTALGLEEHE
jgi:hypothetical protein